MSTMAAPAYGAPLHRKPVPVPSGVVAQRSSYSNLGPESLQAGHSRSRTTSSGVFPAASTASLTTYTAPSTMQSMQSMQSHSQQYQNQFAPQQAGVPGTRRTLSNATSSTSSTTGTPARSNSGLRRSSSSRSGNSPSSYVALMRKQKATVWCDRSQYEDPRIMAAQRAAKMRANMEVAGGPHHAPPRNVSSGSSVATGIKGKLRHHAPNTVKYTGNLAGAGVPMRLSATEVDEGDDEDNGSIGMGQSGKYHHRTGSGRSSLGSGRRVSYANPQGRLSSSSTPPSGHNSSPSEGGMADLAEEETPVPLSTYNASTDYFHTQTGLSGGSGSSGERHFGDVGQLTSLPNPAKEKNDSDLHRRGSVDERTMTMGNTRLFIANPDLSD